MSQVQLVKAPLSLDSVVDNFKQWRLTRVKRGKTPPALMEQSFSLIGRYRITKITSSLGLCFSTFRKQCLERGLIEAKGPQAKACFVEVQTTGQTPAHPFPSSEARIELTVQRCDGTKLRIAGLQVGSASELMTHFLKG